MRRFALKLAPLSLPVLLLALTIGAGPDLGAETPSPSPSPSASPSPEPTAAPTPEPSPTTVPVPAPSPSPQPGYTGSLKPGDWVQVTGTDGCLNARVYPAIPQPQPDGQTYDNVINCLPEGFVGLLQPTDGKGMSQPASADGHWWWYMIGVGWVAEDYLAFHHEGGLPWPERPELANAGLIAYLRQDGSIWLMNADGRGQRQLVPADPAKGGFMYLEWAPSGDQISVTWQAWNADGAVIATRIYSLDGTLVRELSDISSARWSPDGSRLAALRVEHAGEMGGYSAAPVVIDLASGAETPLGQRTFYSAGPSWSPDGASVTFVCHSTVNYETQADGSVIENGRNECGGDGVWIAAADGSSSRLLLAEPEGVLGFAYLGASWSGDVRFIAVAAHAAGGDCRGQIVVDVTSGGQAGCFELPADGPGFGGRCGGFADMTAEWSPDGSRLFYHWESGLGQNGVWIGDVASGQSTVIPVAPANSITVAGGGAHLAFGAAGYIWTADLDGGNLALVAEGHSPAWQPLP